MDSANDSFMKEREKVEETSAFKNTLSYLEDLVENSLDFRREIVAFRKKYKIPIEGYKEVLYGISEYSGEKVILTPPQLMDVPYLAELGDISEKYGLDFMWADLIAHYAFYNSFDAYTYASPIQIIDLKDALSGPEEMEYEGEKWSDDHKRETLDMFIASHPIAILVNPYLSQREIVDYVKKLYATSIKPLQDEYKDPKIKLGKVRRKSNIVRARNKFIYENRNLSKKELMGLVNREFGEMLDYAYITKIITTETKKHSHEENK